MSGMSGVTPGLARALESVPGLDGYRIGELSGAISMVRTILGKYALGELERTSLALLEAQIEGELEKALRALSVRIKLGEAP